MQTRSHSREEKGKDPDPSADVSLYSKDKRKQSSPDSSPDKSDTKKPRVDASSSSSAGKKKRPSLVVVVPTEQPLAKSPPAKSPSAKSRAGKLHPKSHAGKLQPVSHKQAGSEGPTGPERMFKLPDKAELLPEWLNEAPAVRNGIAKFIQALRNPHVLRCYGPICSIPPNLKELPPPQSIDDYMDFDHKTLQTWLKKHPIEIVFKEVTQTWYAYYEYKVNRIIINLKLFEAGVATINTPDHRDFIALQFLVWRKLHHELAHMILFIQYFEPLKMENPTTPVQLFGGEVGDFLEYRLNGAVFHHVGRGFRTFGTVTATVPMLFSKLVVPITWMNYFFTCDVSKFSLEEFRVTSHVTNWDRLDWVKPGKSATTGDENEPEETKIDNSDEERLVEGPPHSLSLRLMEAGIN